MSQGAVQNRELQAGTRPSTSFWRVVELLRPSQWTKNLFCLAGAVFSGRFVELSSDGAAIITCVAFILLSSAVYVFNDVMDRERDRSHPVKRNRPLAKGDVSLLIAAGLGATLLIVGGALARAGGSAVLVCAAVFVVLNLVYTLVFKHVPLLDLLSIAISFVLRLLAGIYAVREMPTGWIVLCTFFLAMFLATAKRRAELSQGNEERGTRPVLQYYSLTFLDSLLHGSGSIAVITYALFTTAGGKNPTLILTAPIVYLAIVRYTGLVLAGSEGQEPEILVVRDPGLAGCILVWIATYLMVVYLPLNLFH